MSSLVIVSVALIAVIGWTNKVESSPAQPLYLSKILDLVQQHQLNGRPNKPQTLQLQVISSDSDSDDSLTDSDESDDLKKNHIIDLLEIAAKKKSKNNRLSNSQTNKNYRQMTDKTDDLEKQRIAKERIIDLLETAAKEKTKINRLSNNKAKKNYDQITVQTDETDDNARLEKERIIDLLESAAKEKTKINRLSNNKAKKNYDQITVQTDETDDNARLEKERIIDLLETAAKEKTKINRLSNNKAKKNYDQIIVQTDETDNARLEKERIIDLINSIAKAENSRNVRILNRKQKPNSIVNGQESVNNNVQKQILEKLFSQPYDGEERKKQPKKRLTPNRLTPIVTMDDVKKYYEKQNNNNKVEITKSNEVTGLEDYSKIYIVLNPQAVQNSKNKNSLKDLISKVLSLSLRKTSTSKRVPEVKKMPRRYKGFLVDDNLQLRRFRNPSDDLDNDNKILDPVKVPLGDITAVPV